MTLRPTTGAAAIGVLLAAAGVLVMWLPVSLGAYDPWGFKIMCGNAFRIDIAQAQLADQRLIAPRPIRTGTNPNYTRQCGDAVALRRALTIPVVGTGVVLVCTYAAAAVLSGERHHRAAGTDPALADTDNSGIDP